MYTIGKNQSSETCDVIVDMACMHYTQRVSLCMDELTHVHYTRLQGSLLFCKAVGSTPAGQVLA